MIAQTGIDGSLKSMELFGHALFQERTHAAIDDVASNQDEVGLLGIKHIHPTGQFLTGIMIAQMEVGGHHHLIRLGQRFRGLQF